MTTFLAQSCLIQTLFFYSLCKKRHAGHCGTTVRFITATDVKKHFLPTECCFHFTGRNHHCSLFAIDSEEKSTLNHCEPQKLLLETETYYFSAFFWYVLMCHFNFWLYAQTDSSCFHKDNRQNGPVSNSWIDWNHSIIELFNLLCWKEL